MTDELMIQPQRVSTTPYLLGGAALGAGAGLLGTALYKGNGAKSYEELVKSANEKDVVELKAKKQALDEAEKKLAEAGKAVYEGNELNELNDAKANLDKKLAELTGSKEVPSSEGFKVKEWDKFKKDYKIKANDYPATNERTGKAFNTKNASRWEQDVINEYNRLKGDYERAVTKFETRDVARDMSKKKDYEAKIQRYMKEVRNAAASKGTKPRDYSRIFSAEEPDFMAKHLSRHGEEFKRAETVAREIYPEIRNPRNITEEQAKAFAQRLEKGETAPKGYRYSVPVKEIVNGREQTVKYAFSQEMFEDFKHSENKNIREQRTQLRTALLENAPKNIELEAQKANFDTKFSESIPKNTAKSTGLTTSKGRVNISSILSESKIKSTDPKTGDVKFKDVKFYNGDINKFEAADRNMKLSEYFRKHPKANINGNYAGAKTVADALEMAEARKNVLEMYVEDYKSMQKDLKATTGDYEFINAIKEKIESAKAENKGIADAKEALLKQFPQLAEGGATTAKEGMTEAAAKETEAYKNLAKIVEEKQTAYDKVAAEKGKVNETAKKAAEDVRNNAKAEFDKIINKLGESAKGMTGKAKLLAIGIPTVVAGAIGWGMANSKNKAAEEALQREIIA